MHIQVQQLDGTQLRSHDIIVKGHEEAAALLPLNSQRTAAAVPIAFGASTSSCVLLGRRLSYTAATQIFMPAAQQMYCTMSAVVGAVAGKGGLMALSAVICDKPLASSAIPTLGEALAPHKGSGAGNSSTRFAVGFVVGGRVGTSSSAWRAGHHGHEVASPRIAAIKSPT
jgi:hypothetical protein